ncbi:MAG: YtxH domain-containing protein [Gemmatimonadales bacterium]|nr:YtxH domain-containing protein [Gemmatimonadales bacterium]
MVRTQGRSGGSLALAVLAGIMVGAGAALLLTPHRGEDVRRRLRSGLGRITTGAMDLWSGDSTEDETRPGRVPVRTVQELGRDPDQVF